MLSTLLHIVKYDAQSLQATMPLKSAVKNESFLATRCRIA